MPNTSRSIIYLRQYAGQVEDLRAEVCQVRHHEYEDGLDHAHLMSEPGHKASGETPNYTYERAADCHHQERGQARQHVRVDDPRRAHLAVRLEHVIEHLRIRIHLVSSPPNP